MEKSFSFEMPLEEWRHNLQDINFWLNGYLKSPAYRDLEEKLDGYNFVHWNVGVGPAACFTRAISSIIGEVKIKKRGPYDHVIEVDMKQAAAVLGTRLNINDKLHIKVAEQLGLIQYKPDMADAELRYYAYNMKKKDEIAVSHWELKYSIAPQMMQKLRTKKYLLMLENLDEPINPIKYNDFTAEGLWLPHPELNESFWLISSTSQVVYDRSNPDYDCVIKSFTGDDILMLTLYSLQQAARYISDAIGHENEQYWHHVVLQCFHYTTMLLIPDSSKADATEVDAHTDVNSSDKLIRQWAAQGILTVMKQNVQERKGEETCSYHCSKYNCDDIYQVGNVILEAFQEYSLLQLPFSPPKKDDEAIKSAAHFLTYHSLIAEPIITLGELCEANHSQLEHTQWISYVGDQGWYVSRDWLSHGPSGATTLTIRHCSQQSCLFMKLQSDHFLAKLSCLRVLDLSYTPLESLPPSICCLQKLQLLSLRGCYNLKSPFSFPDIEATFWQNNSSKKLKLFYLDLSYSNISTFQHDFFHNMPHLKELLLAKCSSLEELPPSTSSLSSLTKLELIDNKKFKSFAGLPEISLEGHGALSSFSLVGTPHIKRLSLRGCKKLESVNIKEVDALEELDLSATAIKELAEDIPNLPQLRQLLLMGVPLLKRFPWHKLQRFPDVFCLDQCSDGIVNCYNSQAAQVCISDSRFFYSFNQSSKNLLRSGQLLKSFYIQVTSCKDATSRKIHDEEDMVKTNKFHVAQTTYADVNRHYLTDGVYMVLTDDVPPFRETEHHVKISTVDQYPHGLKYLLLVTKSISMSDDCHVSCLNDLSALDDLEECKLQRCHQMVHVFKDAPYEVRYTLKSVHASHLKRLSHFCKTSASNEFSNFYALKHLRLEHCPRLEGIVPRDCELRSLVTLDILFCYNLKAIFYNNDRSSSSYNYLRHLRRIRLQELPLLEHLHVDDAILTAPMWEELHVRGCWSLCRLPRLDQQPNKAVKVSGERAWWTKLRWDDGAPWHRGSYEAKLPPAFTSIRERVVIRTYLR